MTWTYRKAYPETEQVLICDPQGSPIGTADSLFMQAVFDEDEAKKICDLLNRGEAIARAENSGKVESEK